MLVSTGYKSSLRGYMFSFFRIFLTCINSISFEFESSEFEIAKEHNFLLVSLRSCYECKVPAHQIAFAPRYHWLLVTRRPISLRYGCLPLLCWCTVRHTAINFTVSSRILFSIFVEPDGYISSDQVR